MVKSGAVGPIDTFPPSWLAGWAGWLAGSCWPGDAIMVKSGAAGPIETWPPSWLAGWAGWLGAAGQAMLSWLKVVPWAL